MKSRAVVLLLSSLLIGGPLGCTAVVQVRPTGPNTAVITISRAPGLGGSDPSAPTTPPPNPSVDPEPNPELPPTETETDPPTNVPPPSTEFPGQTAAIEELKNVYNIEVAGNPTDLSIRNLLVYARQHRPDDIKDLLVEFSDRNQGGILGVWRPQFDNQTRQMFGFITIFAPAKNDMIVVGHECMHHLDKFGEITRRPRESTRIVDELLATVGEDPRGWPSSMITRGYALTQAPEGVAELFSNYRIFGQNLSDRGLTRINPGFNPNNWPAGVRDIVDRMYIDTEA